MPLTTTVLYTFMVSMPWLLVEGRKGPKREMRVIRISLEGHSVRERAEVSRERKYPP